MAAARLADRHSEMAYLWRTGQVDTDLPRLGGVRQVTYAVECQILDAVPCFAAVVGGGVKQVVAVALDLLHPDDRDAKKRPTMTVGGGVSEHGGMTMITMICPIWRGGGGGLFGGGG